MLEGIWYRCCCYQYIQIKSKKYGIIIQILVRSHTFYQWQFVPICAGLYISYRLI